MNEFKPKNGEMIEVSAHKKEYRPYTNDELKECVGKVFRRNNTDGEILMLSYDKGLYYADVFWRRISVIDSNELLEHWTHKDGSPAGVLE